MWTRFRTPKCESGTFGLGSSTSLKEGLKETTYFKWIPNTRTNLRLINVKFNFTAGSLFL